MRWGWLPLVGSLYTLDQSMFKYKYFARLGQLGHFVAPEVYFGLLQKVAARQWTVKSGTVYNTSSLVPKEQKNPGGFLMGPCVNSLTKKHLKSNEPFSWSK